MDESCKSVRDIICGSGDTSTFCEMVTKASKTYSEFKDGLDGDRPYTVFAPTDDAFELYNDEFLDLKEDEMYRTLLFHFYEDVALTGDDLGCSGKLISLTGDMSRTKCVRQSAGVYTKHQRGRGNKDIGDFPVIDVDNSERGCAGVVHKLNHVLLPIVFKPFQPLVVGDETQADVIAVASESEEEEEIVESEEFEEEDIADIVDDEKEVVVAEEEKTELCLFNCDTKPAPPPPKDTTLCFFNCGDAPAEEEVAETEAPVVDEVEEEEPPMIPPPLKTKGVVLIILATLLLCFMFLCLRP